MPVKVQLHHDGLAHAKVKVCFLMKSLYGVEGIRRILTRRTTGKPPGRKNKLMGNARCILHKNSQDFNKASKSIKENLRPREYDIHTANGFFCFPILSKMINVAFMLSFMLKHVIRLTLKRDCKSIKINEIYSLFSVG